MPTVHMEVLDAIERAAREQHVPEPWAVATALVEDPPLDPRAEGDYVNGAPTSFGLYQLHRGGELGQLTPEQAFVPYTNATVSLHYLGQVIAQHPDVSDPGTLAAMAQRPADPAGYAVKVDAQLQNAAAVIAAHQAAGGAGGNLQAGQDPSTTVQPASVIGGITGGITGAGGWVWDNTAGWVWHEASGPIDAGAKAVAAPFVAIYNMFVHVWGFFTSASTWIRIGLAVGGFVLLLVAFKAITGVNPAAGALALAE